MLRISSVEYFFFRSVAQLRSSEIDANKLAKSKRLIWSSSNWIGMSCIWFRIHNWNGILLARALMNVNTTFKTMTAKIELTTTKFRSSNENSTQCLIFNRFVQLWIPKLIVYAYYGISYSLCFKYNSLKCGYCAIGRLRCYCISSCFVYCIHD